MFSSRDGPITLRNPHIADLPEDVLYHLNLSDKANDLPAMFGDVKVTNTHTLLVHRRIGNDYYGDILLLITKMLLHSMAGILKAEQLSVIC